MFVSIVNEFIITLMTAMNHKCCREPDKKKKKKVHAHINTVETIWEIKDRVTAIANHFNWGKRLKKNVGVVLNELLKYKTWNERQWLCAQAHFPATALGYFNLFPEFFRHPWILCPTQKLQKAAIFLWDATSI